MKTFKKKGAILIKSNKDKNKNLDLKKNFEKVIFDRY